MVDKNLNTLIDALRLLRSKSQTASINTISPLMKELNILLLGSKFNKTYSQEIRNFLKENYNTDIPTEEFNNYLLNACAILNMKTLTLVEVPTIGLENPTLAYEVTLW